MVWYGMLDFLAFVWACHDREEGLRRAGFEPHREFIDLSHDLHVYAVIQDRFRPKQSVVIETAEAFLLKAIRDSNPNRSHESAAMVDGCVDSRRYCRSALPAAHPHTLINGHSQLPG